VRGLILVHGFADVPGAIAFQLAKEWQPPLGVAGEALAWFAGKIGWWYMDIPSPENALSKLGPDIHVLFLTAEKDDQLPAIATQKLREALRKSSCRWEEQNLPGTHLRPSETELIREILSRSISWLGQEGLLSAGP
jgi:hypothetical protein